MAGKLSDIPSKGRAVAERPKAKVGRPSKYNPAIAAEICEHIANGLSLRRIGELQGMPHVQAMRRWLLDHEEFRMQYALAREEQADWYADEITHIADTEEDPNRARVRIDARKWVASKLKPKKWGDRLDLTTNGKDMPAPITALQVNLAAQSQLNIPSDASNDSESSD